jgi:hypothetical protein
MPLDWLVYFFSALQRGRARNRRLATMPSYLLRLDLKSAARRVWPQERFVVSASRTPQPRLIALDPSTNLFLSPSRQWAMAAISKRWFPADPFYALSSTWQVVSISTYWKTCWVTMPRANVAVVVALPKQKY